MKNEIKVNEFVRTRYGEIGKVSETYPRLKWRKKKTSSDLDFNSIVKHSSNLIDLIQCGDYVNGEQITDIWNGNRISSVKSNFNEEDIKTIVTKEQFESITYKVTKM